MRIIYSLPERFWKPRGARPEADTSRRNLCVWLIAALTGLLHLAVAGRYDIFRNELYFIVCGRHPDFGYVDQPPLVPLLAAATQAFGDHVWLLRLPAVMAAAGLVLLCAAFARLLGGDNRAAIIAAIAAAIAPGLASLTSTLNTSTFEPVAWTAAAFLLARATLQERRSDLILAGVVAGVAMEAKWGIAVWLIALAIGILATAARRSLWWRELWLGLAIAIALTLPNLIWQWLHGWPFFDVILPHLDRQQDFTGTPWQFELKQAFSMNIALAPLWLAGAAAPFIGRTLNNARFLAIGFIATSVFYYATHGTSYYLFPAYPTMFAVGAVACARLNRWITRAWMAAATALSIAVAPVALPILDPPVLERYLAWSHLQPRPFEAASIGAPLTHVFSDELGWRALEKTIASIYRALPADEQPQAAIFASNYGEAAAIDVYGRADGLPPALSGHNQYYLWGPRGYDGSVIIHVNGDPERWRRLCRSVDIAAPFGAPYVMPYENNRPVFVCRGLRTNLSAIWDRLKRYR
jgi:dolichyl-phosphate-mannose-protein mannosyltransferase